MSKSSVPKVIMDELAGFFDISKAFERKRMPVGACDGRVTRRPTNMDFVDRSWPRNNVARGSGSAKRYVEAEEKLAMVSK